MLSVFNVNVILQGHSVIISVIPIQANKKANHLPVDGSYLILKVDKIQNQL